jgi:glutamate carboxypeptidase
VIEPDVSTPSQLRGLIEFSRDAILSRLCSLVLQETPSGDVDASRTIAEDIAGRLGDQAGATASLHDDDSGTHVVIDIAGRSDESPVLLLGHSDTVWPVGTLASSIPWSIAGDVVAGPGVYDMKGGLVVIETALHALRTLGLAHRPTRVTIVADEEVGSGSSRELVTRSMQGVEAVIGLEAPHPDGSFKIGRFGSARVNLSVVGRAAHAALEPELGISAIDELVDQLVNLRELVDDATHRSSGTVLFNVGTVAGGGKANVVADRAEALLGLRFSDAVTENAVLGRILSLDRPQRPGALLRAELITRRPPWASGQGDRDLLARVRSIAGRAKGQIRARSARGAADTNEAGAAGIPTLDGFGPLGGGAHSLSEHIRFSTLLDRAVLLALVLHAL